MGNSESSESSDVPPPEEDYIIDYDTIKYNAKVFDKVNKDEYKDKYIIDFSDAKFADGIDLEDAFSNCKVRELYLPTEEFQAGPSLKRMLYQCLRLEKVDFGGMKTDNVTNMSQMFESCLHLGVKTSYKHEYFDGIICNYEFNTANVTDMSRMFYAARICHVLDFNTSNVINMEKMFYGCTCNRKVGQSAEVLDINHFTAHQDVNINAMFSFIRTGKILCKNFDFSKTKYDIDTKILNEGYGYHTYNGAQNNSFVKRTDSIQLAEILSKQGTHKYTQDGDLYKLSFIHKKKKKISLPHIELNNLCVILQQYKTNKNEVTDAFVAAFIKSKDKIAQYIEYELFPISRLISYILIIFYVWVKTMIPTIEFDSFVKAVIKAIIENKKSEIVLNYIPIMKRMKKRSKLGRKLSSIKLDIPYIENFELDEVENPYSIDTAVIPKEIRSKINEVLKYVK